VGDVDSVNMYQIPELLAFPKLIHAFSDKNDGDLSAKFSPESEVVLKRIKFLAKLNLTLEDCVKINVCQSNKVIRADENLKGISLRDWTKAPNADGLVTNKKGTFLFLLTADCLPIIFYDPIREAVGLIHAGWKGTDLNIASRAVEKFVNLYKTNPKDLIVGFGPAARKDSYKKENPSQKDDPKWKGFINPFKCNFYKVDFVGLCKKQLIDSGVLERNIFDSKIDTIKDNRFFSHIREGKLPFSQQGRFASLVGIKN